MDEQHDHSAATHKMNCPVDGCTYVMTVHAHDDDQAVDMLIAQGEAHFASDHPEVEGMDDNQKRETTQKMMEKVQ